MTPLSPKFDRQPTDAAMASLVRRFPMPAHHTEEYQWDPARVESMLTTYESGHLNDDERHLLVLLLLQTFQSAGDALPHSAGWRRLLSIIDRDIDIHISSVHYWLSEAEFDPNGSYPVVPDLTPIWKRHMRRFT